MILVKFSAIKRHVKPMKHKENTSLFVRVYLYTTQLFWFLL